MLNRNTDRDWEKVGRNDPYYGVITHDKYRMSNLTDENKEELFRSGYEYVNTVISNIRKHIDPTFTIRKALDFGCGVGRLIIPLADIAESVTGMDVSDSMLNEARNNCELRSLENVTLAKSDDNLSSLIGKYDFINSFIVFQHIPVSRGERIFRNLLAHLEDDGVCVVHFTYAKDRKTKGYMGKIKKYVPLAKNIINIIKRRGFFAPQLQMNNYKLDRIFSVIQLNQNIREFYVEHTNHDGTSGIIIYFKKPSNA